MNRRGFLYGVAGLVCAVAIDACASQTSKSQPANTPAKNAAGLGPVSTVAPATATTGSTTATVPIGPAGVAGWAPGTPAVYVNHGPTMTGKVALTFHLGGDPKLVVRLLDLLHGHGVHSTLFAIGDWITAHPDITRRAVVDGHELGNHTKTHPDLLKLSAAHVRAEIQGGADALEPFIGSIGKWFRPSGTDVPNQTILDEAGNVGYPVSDGYDIDSRDFTEPGSRAVIDKVNAAIHPGAIVSLHFGHSDTIGALPAILTHLDSVGLTTATVTDLLG